MKLFCWKDRHVIQGMRSVLALAPCLALTNGACVSAPGVRQFSIAETPACAEALATLPNIANEDRTGVFEICGVDERGELSDPSTVTDIAQIRTWSGPNGRCEYPFIPVLDQESPTNYYLRAVMPLQNTRYFLVGMNSHAEMDIDCITRAFPDIGSEHFNWRDDPVSQYARGYALLQGGCVNSESAFDILTKAGRFSVPKEFLTVDMFVYKRQKNLIPEALYIAGLVKITCDGDVDMFYELSTESARGGYPFLVANPLASN